MTINDLIVVCFFFTLELDVAMEVEGDSRDNSYWYNKYKDQYKVNFWSEFSLLQTLFK